LKKACVCVLTLCRAAIYWATADPETGKPS
jgi:hypothetical protein